MPSHVINSIRGRFGDRRLLHSSHGKTILFLPVFVLALLGVGVASSAPTLFFAGAGWPVHASGIKGVALAIDGVGGR